MQTLVLHKTIYPTLYTHTHTHKYTDTTPYTPHTQTRINAHIHTHHILADTHYFTLLRVDRISTLFISGRISNHNEAI